MRTLIEKITILLTFLAIGLILAVPVGLGVTYLGRTCGAYPPSEGFDIFSVADGAYICTVPCTDININEADALVIQTTLPAKVLEGYIYIFLIDGEPHTAMVISSTEGVLAAQVLDK